MTVGKAVGKAHIGLGAGGEASRASRRLAFCFKTGAYMKKTMKTASFLFAVGATLLAVPARAEGLGLNLPGSYTYKLVLRDGYGFALDGVLSGDGDGRVSSNYNIEVYDADGAKVSSTAYDAAVSGGHNCSIGVSVGEGSGCAKVGSRLTLVVTDAAFGIEMFRSANVLPPVGGTFGYAAAPVGVFFAADGDTDAWLDSWRREVGFFLPAGAALGANADDYDADGIPNLREYQLGTDPTGGAIDSMMDKPSFSAEAVEGREGVYKVSFACDPKHVYSVRAVEGEAAFGSDGQDLALYAGLDELDAGTASATYVYDAEADSAQEVYVKAPEFDAAGLLGLAVDGRLQEYIALEAPQTVGVTPGFPLSYASEADALAAKAIAEIAPSEAVAGVLTGDGASDGYKGSFTVEVREAGGTWELFAQLTPEATSNLVENANAAAFQLPVGAVALLPSEATTNVVVTGCTPGFYYSLCTGTAATDIAADARSQNLDVLCGADGEVAFPAVSKPADGAGFFRIGICEAERQGNE